ncbi:MAG TPA: hypothetical protein VLB73_04890 [Patescibacteria group bacterium]|nr:hypothetical protein [Patescibacteria group bacterium]
MPRKKKTREQKKRADERKIALGNTSGESIATPTYVFTAQNIQHQLKNFSGIHDATKIVTHDLRKTMIISFTIVALQLLFFFLLKNHILAIGFVRY